MPHFASKHKDTLLKKRKPNSLGSQKMDPNVIFQPKKNETNGLKTIFFLQNLHQSHFLKRSQMSPLSVSRFHLDFEKKPFCSKNGRETIFSEKLTKRATNVGLNPKPMRDVMVTGTEPPLVTSVGTGDEHDPIRFNGR